MRKLHRNLSALIALIFVLCASCGLSAKDGNITVNLLGEFKTEQRADLPGNATVLDAYALAGGATAVANLKKARILRRGTGEPETITLNLKSILAGNSPDVPLRNGDTLILDQKFF